MIIVSPVIFIPWQMHHGKNLFIMKHNRDTELPVLIVIFLRKAVDISGQNINVKIEGGNIFHPNFPFQAGYMAQFEKASILYSTFKSDIIQVASDTNLELIPASDAGEGFLNEIAYFAKCIKNNIQPTECMPESSLQTVCLCYDHLN
jgi:hypothetical protein